MRLNPRDFTALIAKPNPDRAGLLIHGADAMRVALKRQDYLAAFLGPRAEDEMRLTRLNGSDLRRDGALVQDAMRAAGFFPGPRAVLVDEANEFAAPALENALQDWRKGDGQIVVTAGLLKKTSKLLKAFEGNGNAFATAIYDDPPSRAEITEQLAKSGLPSPAAAALTDIEALARQLDPGDFRQMVEKLTLYKLNDPAPLTSAEVALLAPATIEADVDEVLHAAAEGQLDRIAPLMSRLEGQGVAAVTLCIFGIQHFRKLHAAASDPKGAAAGIGRLRPPVFGPRRDRMIRQASTIGLDRLEMALAMLTETDLSLRSARQTAPQMAVVERMFMRLAQISRKRS